jgi:hypothetical protein
VIGARAQERIWAHVLVSLASHVGVMGQVQTRVTCIDPRCQWSEARNIWHNVMLRSFAFTITSPVRRVLSLWREKGGARTVA